ncbi:MAG: hypothetical protein IKK33_04760 [Lachnospiraceae bacterium]|nr:hypothetical protein [Lachnospiraceae bacterium]
MMKTKHNDMKKYLLWMLAILVNIKSVFTDFGADQAYAVATSYRHIMGDRMFGEMCEPHQTSAFLTDFLMTLYKVLVPDLTGVVIFLQVCGVFLNGIVAYCLYKELIHWISGDLAQYISIFFFIFRPKQSVFPEFSNMQMMFAVLCLVCILGYLRSMEKNWYLVGVAFFLSLQILSYPTCLINYVGITVFLGLFSNKKWKAVGILTGSCMIFAFSYVLIVLSQVGFEQLLASVEFIVNADKSHVGNVFDIGYYLEGFGYGLIWIVGSLVLAFGLYRLSRKKICYFTFLGAILLLSEIIMIIATAKSNTDWSCQYFMVIPVVMILGICCYKCMENTVRKIYVLGMIMGFGSFVAVCSLTNLELLSIISYLMPAAMVSLIPIYERLKCAETKSKIKDGLILCILLLVLFHRGMVVCGYANESGIKITPHVENFIRVGPAKGIVTSLQKCNEIKYSMEDWDANIQEDTVLVVVPWMLDSIVYVNEQTETATFSTIDTPTYDENLLRYWERYPDKVPTVIAVKAWNNEITISQDTWIMQWINENYTQYEDGHYWRFYRK